MVTGSDVAKGANVNVCWTGVGQTVVLIDQGLSLFTYLAPTGYVDVQQLMAKE